MKCYECKWLDRSVILTSNPPQYGCTLGFGSHYADHECEYDFMPIVRCKDCRWWQDNNNGYPHDDGTLEVKVSNAQKVGRVLVMDSDSHIGGGLFYPADAEQGYTEWLEKIIVDNEGANEWLCEGTPDMEWCEKNCHYSSIQAECLRHLYEVSKGGDDE